MNNDRETWEEFLYLLDKYSDKLTNPDGTLKINNIVRYYKVLTVWLTTSQGLNQKWYERG